VRSWRSKVRVDSKVLATILIAASWAPDVSLADGTTLPWSVSGPPAGEQHSPGDSLEFTVAVGAQDAAGLRVIAARLIEQSHRNRLFPDGFEVCTTSSAPTTRDASNCTELSATIAKSTSVGFRLRAKNPGNAPAAGHFLGPVLVVSDGYPLGQSVNVEVYVSSAERQALGVLVVFIGSLFGWLLSNWAKNRYNRGQLLLPAAFAQQRLAAIKQTLTNAPAAAQTGTTAANTLTLIDSLIGALTPAALQAQGYIPGEIPSPTPAPPAKIGDYPGLITSTHQWAGALEMLVNAGMQRAWQRLGADGVTEAAIRTAISAIDPLSTSRNQPPPDANTINTKIASALNPLNVLPAGGAALATDGQPTIKTLTVELTRTSLFIWIGVIVFTTLAGAAVVVFSNPGFGVLTDFIACAFFGLGLPTGAAMLQMNAQTVSTNLGVTTK